ncbi:MAG: nonstructural protein [Microviridae sp.]|nr:MAG: nonstructural protein [Microviridae sp.]
MMHIVALYDSKAEFYQNLMCVPNINAFIRLLGDEINSNEVRENWAKHPADFKLVDFGLFDEVQGFFDIEKSPKTIIQLDALKQS